MAMDPNITVPQNPEPNQPAPEGPPILTKDDLKHIQDQDIYLATRDPQAHEGLKATMREAIREEIAALGVLTVSNFGEMFARSADVRHDLDDAIWETERKFLDPKSP